MNSIVSATDDWLASLFSHRASEAMPFGQLYSSMSQFISFLNYTHYAHKLSSYNIFYLSVEVYVRL